MHSALPRLRAATLALPLLCAGCPDDAGSPDAGADAADAQGDASRPDAWAFLDGETPDVPMPNDVDHPGTFVEDAPTRTVTYRASDAIFANPERGFYRAVDLLDERELSWLREDHPHDSLIYSYVMLDRFRDREITAATLADVREALALARANGFEVVLRFAYNLGPYPDAEPDAPLSRIEAHLAQLAPILREEEDVIALVQAGFIGAWGEWHSSTNGLDSNPTARRAVVTALLDAMPTTRATQVRYPPYIGELVGGAPLEEAQAWSGSFASRIGFHNDCFVSSETDVGTYPSREIERWKTFIDAHSRFVPVGGETCDPNPPRSACASTLAEMERHHYSFINRDYHPDIVAGWEDGGCLDEMERRLGYRFVLLDAALPERVRPGGTFRLRVRLRNEGFAAPFNPRQLELVLREGTTVHRVALERVEVRSLFGGADHEIVAHVQLPAGLSSGAHTLALALPSPSERLRDRSEYAIRFANEAVWDATRGENVLGTLDIDDAAPGTSDRSAPQLRLLD